MRFEDAMAEAYQDKSSPIDPGLLDKDFDICIIARSNMTQPCRFTQAGFFATYTEAACWMGHILKAAKAGGLNGLEVPGEDDVCAFVQRISEKLGFYNEVQLYIYNDSHSHPEVIREFDRRLQLWT